MEFYKKASMNPGIEEKKKGELLEKSGEVAILLAYVEKSNKELQL